MATIEFKGKVKKVYNMDDSLAYEYIKIPALKKNHCDMAAFRSHKKYGGFANSDLFQNILARIKKQVFGNNSELKLSAIPENVKVNNSSFLAVVSFEV